MKEIKNIVFDIGNVFVRWAPAEIVRLAFGSRFDPETTAARWFQSEIWIELNKGRFSEEEAKQRFEQTFDLSRDDVDRLFYYIHESQIAIYGTRDLLNRLKAKDYKVYALTDNVHEIVAFLKSRYLFWPLFDGAIVSAEVNCLKPGAEIFQHLLSQYDLDPAECVFIDDVQANVDGAKSVGMKGIQFTQAHLCEEELLALGVTL
ncbi:HAD family hydrolase [Thaumasiovibrio subtropicus]|uniref:HAD family hydrolase n=1 Tax=Thaumasiovibrio subtropicus TaxID=1891207 RepID=UPI000B362912|nr:HAD family phosphatase [Thaumasiovibrio subtropicus]